MNLRISAGCPFHPQQWRKQVQEARPSPCDVPYCLVLD